MTAKTPTKKVEVVSPKIQLEKPQDIKLKRFDFVGKDELAEEFPQDINEIAENVKKFQTRFGVKLRYQPRFKAFRLYKQEKHVDWILFNDLMKRYDTRIPPMKMQFVTKIQRPYDKKRAY